MATRVRWVIALTMGAWLLTLSAAEAYVDPGTGSFVFQAIVGGAMAAGLGIKVFWRRIAGAFRKKTPEQSDAGDTRGADEHV